MVLTIVVLVMVKLLGMVVIVTTSTMLVLNTKEGTLCVSYISGVKVS